MSEPLGKLGIDRAIALHMPNEQFESPSDFSGVLYIPSMMRADGNLIW